MDPSSEWRACHGERRRGEEKASGEGEDAVSGGVVTARRGGQWVGRQTHNNVAKVSKASKHTYAGHTSKRERERENEGSHTKKR